MNNELSGSGGRAGLRVALSAVSLACLLVTTTMSTVAAVTPQTDAGRPSYTDADWALLPAWCIDSQDGIYGSPRYSGDSKFGRNLSPRSDYWTTVFGRDFWHLHHYCRALYAERRMLRASTPKERVAALHTAISEYLYVIRESAESMPLLPEVYYRLGEMYLRKDERGAAGEAFAAARRLKPDYWPAYTRWADELIALRLIDQARVLVEDGLAHAPQNPQLLERQARLAAQKNTAPRSQSAAAGPPRAVGPAASGRDGR